MAVSDQRLADIEIGPDTDTNLIVTSSGHTLGELRGQGWDDEYIRRMVTEAPASLRNAPARFATEERGQKGRNPPKGKRDEARGGLSHTKATVQLKDKTKGTSVGNSIDLDKVKLGSATSRQARLLEKTQKMKEGRTDKEQENRSGKDAESEEKMTTWERTVRKKRVTHRPAKEMSDKALWLLIPKDWSRFDMNTNDNDWAKKGCRHKTCC
jgi:hypothetical protein